MCIAIIIDVCNVYICSVYVSVDIPKSSVYILCLHGTLPADKIKTWNAFPVGVC